MPQVMFGLWELWQSYWTSKRLYPSELFSTSYMIIAFLKVFIQTVRRTVNVVQRQLTSKPMKLKLGKWESQFRIME
jgi:hypothetical protein